MTKILFLGPPASPHAADWIRYLEARGHEVRVGTIHEVPAWAESRTRSLRTRGDLARPGSMMDILEALPRLRGLAREFRPEVTLAYYLTSYGMLAAVAGLPRIVGATAGGDVLVHPFYPRSRRIRQRFLLGLTLRRLTKVFAWAPHVAARLRRLGVQGDRIVVQPRGIHVERFVGRRDRALRPPVPHLVSMRWFKKLYDIPTLVRALGRLAEMGHPFRATLVGEGPEAARLRDQVSRAGIAHRVDFPGKIGREAIVELLDSADVYVSTSSTDGASASLFEAMAMGAYPIVTDIPANRPWIEPGINGELFPVGDDEELAAAVVRAWGDETRLRAARDRNRSIVMERLNFHTNMRRLEMELLATLNDAATRDV